MKLTILTLDNAISARANLHQLAREAFPQDDIIQTTSPEQAEKVLSLRTPNIVLWDVADTEKLGLTFIQSVKKKAPKAIPVIVSQCNEADVVYSAFKQGAMGYLLKTQNQSDLIAKLRGIVQGEPPLSPYIEKLMIDYISCNNQPEVDFNLSHRDEEILVLLSRGFSRQDMAKMLNLSPHTVAYYIKELYHKMGVHSRAEAAVAACQIGLIRVN